MSIYATTTSLATTMIGYTFDSVTTALASKCITDAQNEVRKYLGRRYSLTDTNLALTTTSTVPPMVTTWTEQWAEGLMYIRQSRGGKESLTRGKEMLAMVQDNLERIADGSSDLIATNGSIVAEKSSSNKRVLSSTSTYTPTFAEDDPLNWIVDKDKLDDIEDSRE